MAQQEGVCLLSTNSFSQLIENPIANIIMLLVAVWLLYKALPKVKALYKNKKEKVWLVKIKDGAWRIAKFELIPD